MTKKEKEQEQEEYSSIVNANSMLLSFEGWVKFIEGFTKGISSTKTVESVVVLDCIGEILEYMTQLRGQLYNLLIHCEKVLEEDENLKIENEKLNKLIGSKIEEKNDGQEM